MAKRGQNPYVGPRAFEEADSPNFFGREEETPQLIALVVARRALVVHAASGAGKSSLLKASVIPQLRQRRHVKVLLSSRVGREVPPGVDRATVRNIYIFNTLLDIAGEDVQPGDLVGRTLSEGLRHHFVAQSDHGRVQPCLLVLDQFEELFTTHPERYPERPDFFAQLQQSLIDYPQLSLLLSMREDYIAQLDPYAALLPDRLRTRFRLELLGEEAARRAIQQPAQQAGVDFTDTAAATLVNNLRRMRFQRLGGTLEERPGPYVEPVQLQVVCRRLWEMLPADATQVGEADVAAVGDVDRALADYYTERMQAIARQTGVQERAIREWFDRHLITEQGIRGQVLQGPERSQGLENPAIWSLVDAHLVRAEERRGATWFELAHDRLIEPVQKNNAAWYQANLSPLQRQAALWDEQHRPPGLLLRGEALEDAERGADTHQDALTPTERDFLVACREARNLAKRERRNYLFMCGLAFVATIAMVVALFYYRQARQSIAAAENLSKVLAATYQKEQDRESTAKSEAEKLAAEIRRLTAALEQGSATQPTQQTDQTAAYKAEILTQLKETSGKLQEIKSVSQAEREKASRISDQTLQNVTQTTKKADQAATYERAGVEALLDSKLTLAREKFCAAYDVFQVYHNVDEICRKVLTKDLVNKYNDATEDQKRVIAQDILKRIQKDYKWGIPQDLQTAMQKKLEQK